MLLLQITICLILQGVVAPDLNTTQRTGCRAMVYFLCTEDHGWYVSRFLDSHNHPLSPTVNERRQWTSHNKIDPVARELIRNLGLTIYLCRDFVVC
jgi:hypothetical protein